MPFLQLRNVSKAYGRVVALRDVSLELEPGAIGLVGNNGAGKSTMLKVLLGLLTPDTGEGSILGLDIERASTKIRGIVGYMPEITATVPMLKGAEFITLSGDLYGMPHREAKRRAHEVLNYVGLGELRYRKLDEYSTGNLQRLKLAAALVHDPQILLLDEPTNGLDPRGRIDMLRTVEDLIAETGKSVILCTHLLGDVERLCKQVVVLDHGTVILSGEMEELKHRAACRYELMWHGESDGFVTALERSCEAVMAPHWAQRNGRANGPETNSGAADGASLAAAALPELPGFHAMQVTVTPQWQTRRFFEMASEHGVTIRRLRPVEENLQELFLRVTDYAEPQTTR